MPSEKIYKLPLENLKSGSGLSIRSIFSLFLLCTLSSGLSTQWVAYKLEYQDSLGLPLLFKFYFPFDFFKWYLKFGHVPGTEIAFQGGSIIMASLLFLFLPATFFAISREKKYAQKFDLHGSAQWANIEEIKGTGLFNGEAKGVYVGAFQEIRKRYLLFSTKITHYLTHEGPEHILCFAPTRSGKGVGLVIPTLLSWRHSCLVHDIKGENWALTSGFRKAIGQICLKFDPTSTDGSSVRFNPLSEIRVGTDNEVKDVQNIATMIIDPDGKGMSDHWAKTGYALLVGAILHVLYAEEDKTLRGIARFLSDPERNIQQTMEIMLNTPHLGSKPHPVVAESARELLNKAENERSGVLSTTMSFLSLYRDPVVARNTAFSEFRINDLMNHEKAVSLYLIVPPSDKDRIKPLLRLILNQVIRRLTEKMEFDNGRSVDKYKHKLLLLIDEFPALGKLDIFQESLAFIAGYGLKAYLIVQDLSQLYSAYGKDEAIVSNCHIRIAYAPNKIETAELLSKMAGKTTVQQHQRSYSGKRLNPFLSNVSTSIQMISRSLLTADEAMRISKDDSLIFVAGYSPIYGKKIKYFSDSIFDQRSKIKSPKNSDRIYKEEIFEISSKQIAEKSISIQESVSTPMPSSPSEEISAFNSDIQDGSVEDLESTDIEAKMSSEKEHISEKNHEYLIDFEV
jgi:type IV secretion system protein VirD4